MSNYILLDIKGNIETLDPKSKVITTLFMVLGVALSVEPFSVAIFAVFTIPLAIIYRPRPSFLKKALYSLPFSIIFTIMIYFSIQGNVIVNIFYFSRSYTKLQFASLVIFRFTVSILHTTILIESVSKSIDLIEAIAGLGINDTIVSILLLIDRISRKVQSEVHTKLLAARARGFKSKGFNSIIFRMRIYANVFVKLSRYSDALSDSLTARGFRGSFSQSGRSWSSDGIAVALLGISLSIFTISIPLMR